MPLRYRQPSTFPASLHRLWEELERHDFARTEPLSREAAKDFQELFRHFRFCLRQTPSHAFAAYEKAFAPRATLKPFRDLYRVELRPRTALLFLAQYEANNA